MLKVFHPPGREPEKTWAIEVVLGEHLGLEFETGERDINVFTIESEGRRLNLPDVFFRMADERWLDQATLPDLPLESWDSTELSQEINLVSESLPVLYGNGTLSASEHAIQLPLDVFGSAFFLLSRYEEMVAQTRDRHGRFPITESVAHRAGFAHRPLVDEYTEALWTTMTRLWPGLRRKRRSFVIHSSCDVDLPYDYTVRGTGRLARRIAGDLTKRKSASLAMDTVKYAWSIFRHGTSADRMWTFDWMMSTCEQAGTRCAFYFLTDRKHALDCPLYWGNREIEALMQDMHSRGHEIGLHASYTASTDATKIRTEFQRLTDTCDRLRIRQTQWGGRQHYLRWKATETWRNWSDAGLAYDSTLAFAESPGFRCGTCHAYHVFDIAARKPLGLVEKPLLVMDASLLAPQYLALSSNDAKLSLAHYKSVVRKLDGEFTILWHNSRLLNDEQRELFTYAIKH